VTAQFGFFKSPSADYSRGVEPAIAARLDQLAKDLHLHLVGLSGYRSPAHSVAVGGTANDPHTHGTASDTLGVERIPESVLNKYGLTRPMTTWHGRDERNHIQLLPGAHPDHGSSLLQSIERSLPGPLQPVGQVLANADQAGVDTSIVTDPVQQAAETTAGFVVSKLWDAVSGDAMRAGLYVLLVVGGLMLALGGVRQLSRHAPQGATP
jgi:hypothetical protein